MRAVRGAVMIVLLGATAPGAWASNFAGTWVAQPELTEFAVNPLLFSVQGGRYHRSSCTPFFDIPADGKEQAVTGDPFIQAMTVRVLDKHRLEISKKHQGREFWRGRYALARDGRTMTLDFVDSAPATPVSGSIRYERDGDPMHDAHPLSGAWYARKLLKISAPPVWTLSDTEDGLTMSANDGRGFDIKFDRRDYPLTGYLPGATVQVGHRTPVLLQINRRQDGVLIEMSLGDVSEDGTTMKLTQFDEQCKSSVIWTMRKQGAP